MDILNLIGQIVRDLLIFVGVCLALLVDWLASLAEVELSPRGLEVHQ